MSCCTVLTAEQQERMGVGASTAERAAYNGLHRLGWALSLAWLVLACCKGAAGPINTVLAWRAWRPLARLRQPQQCNKSLV